MKPAYSFDQFTAVQNYIDLSFSPDGNWVVYCTNPSGQFNLWRQRVDLSDNGPYAPIQLTDLSESALLRAVWSPDGKRLITMVDYSGYELYQLFEASPTKGELSPLTTAQETRHELARVPFSPDGRFLAYASNERDLMAFDAVIRNMETGEVRIVAEGGLYFPDSWSSDGRFLLIQTMGETANNNLYLCDLETGEMRCVTEHDGEALFVPGAWHPDGKLYFLSNDCQEFTGLAVYDLETGLTSWVEKPAWDVQTVEVSRDGRYLAWVVNEGGLSRLYVRDFQTDQITCPHLPSGVIGKILFSPAQPLLGLYLSRSVCPTDLYMLNVESGMYGRLTHSFKGEIPEAEMVEPELVHYPTHDGRQIPGFLYKPKTTSNKPVPVVISIHGGPEDQERPTYTGNNGFYQYLLHRGIAVFTPNIRGSTGYGKTYQRLIHRDWGGAELRDLECAFQYLQKLDWVDAAHVGLFGASFGGFAVLSCVSRLPNCPWAAAVDISGPSNLITFTQTVPAYAREYMKAMVGDPEEDLEMLQARSPITHVEQIHAPLLVIQGAHDPVVPATESEQIVTRLSTLSREVVYRVFEDEGHMFAKTSSWLEVFKLSADWFERHLLS